MKITAIYRNFTMPATLFAGNITPPLKKGAMLSDVFEKSENKPSRELTENEIELLKTMPGGVIVFKNENGELANFIELMDLNSGIKNAIELSKSAQDTLRYKRLSKVDENGHTVITSKDTGTTILNGRLSPDEITLLVLSKHPRLTASLVQAFMDLKNIGGLSDKEALKIACSSTLSKKFFDMTTQDENGVVTLEDKNGNSTVLKRPLTTKEAIMLLKTDNKKIQTFVELVDSGVKDDVALQIIKIDARIKRFLSLTTPNEEGKLVLEGKSGKKTELQRALTIDEALIAMKEGYSNQKLEEQLTLAGHIFHTKRHP